MARGVCAWRFPNPLWLKTGQRELGLYSKPMKKLGIEGTHRALSAPPLANETPIPTSPSPPTPMNPHGLRLHLRKLKTRLVFSV